MLKVKGRDPVFKCSICGKFCSYDRRTVNIKQELIYYFDAYEEQWTAEHETIFTHKNVNLKNKVLHIY